MDGFYMQTIISQYFFFLAISCSTKKKSEMKWKYICLVSFPGYYQTQEEEDKLPP